MTTDTSFDILLSSLRGGGEHAAQQVFERYVQRLIGLARTRLSTRVQQKVDPEDVLQSVYLSFFTRMANGQFDLSGWDSIWAVLAVITLRKCGRKAEYFAAERRALRREVAPQGDPDGSQPAWEPIGREPTPDEATALTDTVEDLMRGLDERERQMFSLALQGHDLREISAQVDRSERTVRRVMDRIKNQLERLNVEG